MKQTLTLNPELINRYDKAGPRYTSYPTAAQFDDRFTRQQYLHAAKLSNEDPVPVPLSLYFHIPFCNTICYYCACNKVVTKNRQRAVEYLNYLSREIEMHAALYDQDRVIQQLHWGGGTPTFLDDYQILELMSVTQKHFNLRNDDKGDYSVEIDPRTVTDDTITTLRETGFNRISLGVQDFEPTVQAAVNRIQSEQQTQDIIDSARGLGYKSINIDLIYGLPFQSVTSFNSTLDKVIRMSPDRISMFNYAHLPKLFKPQRRINVSDLPSADEKLSILQQAVDQLGTAGYIYIGMDHFAKPDDELVQAQQNGSLHRNFQGYSTHKDCDLIGMGVSAISQISHCYCQNKKTLDDYYSQIDKRHLPVDKGVLLTNDDLIRRDIIMQLICHFKLDCNQFEEKHHIGFNEYFVSELADLQQMQQDGLVLLEKQGITVQNSGRFLIRNICMVFDAYMRKQMHGNTSFSKVI